MTDSDAFRYARNKINAYLSSSDSQMDRCLYRYMSIPCASTKNVQVQTHFHYIHIFVLLFLTRFSFRDRVKNLNCCNEACNKFPKISIY